MKFTCYFHARISQSLFCTEADLTTETVLKWSWWQRQGVVIGYYDLSLTFVILAVFSISNKNIVGNWEWSYISQKKSDGAKLMKRFILKGKTQPDGEIVTQTVSCKHHSLQTDLLAQIRPCALARCAQLSSSVSLGTAVILGDSPTSWFMSNANIQCQWMEGSHEESG